MPNNIGSHSPPAFRMLIGSEYTEAMRQMTRWPERAGVRSDDMDAHHHLTMIDYIVTFVQRFDTLSNRLLLSRPVSHRFSKDFPAVEIRRYLEDKRGDIDRFLDEVMPTEKAEP